MMKFVRLYHGTDLASANQLLAQGVVAALAALPNGGGESWPTRTPATADLFAKATRAGGTPVRSEFELSEPTLLWLVTQNPSTAVRHSAEDFEFLPPSFDVLNQSM